MTEEFLYFLWENQPWKTILKTTDNEQVIVFQKGIRNQNEGADFQEARLKIGTIEWAGAIEIDIQNSDWKSHKHAQNSHYQNVILRILWENTSEKSELPTIILKNFVSDDIIQKFQILFQQNSLKVCENFIKTISENTHQKMLERMFLERITRKKEQFFRRLSELENDWESLCYELVFQYWGMGLNKESFRRLSQLLSYKLIEKHRTDSLSVEGLLFGVAGFLENPCDEYASKLKKEYIFLSQKYTLESPLSSKNWDFFRTRPNNFPTLRIAQIAQFLHQFSPLYSTIIDFDSEKELLEKWNKLELSSYWKTHLHFNKTSKKENDFAGKKLLFSLIINVFIPVLVASAELFKKEELYHKALKLVQKIPAEENQITKQWSSLGVKLKTAKDSQAALEWNEFYCKPKKCMNCLIFKEYITPKGI